MNNQGKKKYTFGVYSAPIAWLDYSEELREIAQIIFKHSGSSIYRYPDLSTSLTLERGFFLNYGFSIETLLKGLLIAENPNLVAEGEISQEITQGHNLIMLSKKVQSFTFSNQEINLLQILSDAIPYWGRYPIPKKHSQISEQIQFTEQIKNDLERLWFKIGKCLYEKIKFGWEGPSGIETGPYLSSTFETDTEFEASLEKLSEMKRKGEIKYGNIDLKKLLTTYKNND